MIAALALLAALPIAGTVAQACDDQTLARARIAGAGEAAQVGTELDRRAQLVLAEERRVDGAPGAGRWPAAAASAAVAGALLAAIAINRRRRGAALVGLVIAAAGAAGTVTLERRAEARARQLVTLGRCRLMLAESQRAVLATQLGDYTHRIDELDEDSTAWESGVRAGGAVTLPQLVKVRGELKPK